MAIYDNIDAERIYLPTGGTNVAPHAFAYAIALGYVQGKKVLDICCGTGYGTKLIAEAAKHVIGIDYSNTAIAYALRSKPDNCVFLCKDAESDLPLKSYNPDVITCMQGLEHLDNPKALIEKYKDKTWIFALPNGGEDIENHHYNITEELIRDWFGQDVKIKYFNDLCYMFDDTSQWYTNFIGVYNEGNQ